MPELQVSEENWSYGQKNSQSTECNCLDYVWGRLGGLKRSDRIVWSGQRGGNWRHYKSDALKRTITLSISVFSMGTVCDSWWFKTTRYIEKIALSDDAMLVDPKGVKRCIYALAQMPGVRQMIPRGTTNGSSQGSGSKVIKSSPVYLNSRSYY